MRGLPASRTPAVERNPQLIGLRCIRCATSQLLGDYPLGCPRCAAEDMAANLMCVYSATDGPNAPYLGAVSLGEGQTSLVPLPADGLCYGKSEYLNPTGSHKDRYSAQAVSHALHAGYKRVYAASSGNAGVSLAAYCARAGLPCGIVVTPHVPAALRGAMEKAGAEVHVVERDEDRWTLITDWTTSDAAAISLTNTAVPVVGSSPFGIEGYKAIAWELLAQLGQVPANVLVPSSRGDLLWGIALGFQEIAAGRGGRSPRLFCVEPFARAAAVLAGSATVTDAFPGDSGNTPSIAGDSVTYQTLAAIQSTGGDAVVAGPAAVRQASSLLWGHGFLVEASSAAALGAYNALREAGSIAGDEPTVCILTSHVFKGL